MLNSVQRIVVENYCAGEFSYVTSVEQARKVGDTLFVFLMLELSDEDEPRERIERAIAQLEYVLEAL